MLRTLPICCAEEQCLETSTALKWLKAVTVTTSLAVTDCWNLFIKFLASYEYPERLRPTKAHSSRVLVLRNIQWQRMLRSLIAIKCIALLSSCAVCPILNAWPSLCRRKTKASDQVPLVDHPPILRLYRWHLCLPSQNHRLRWVSTLMKRLLLPDMQRPVQ